MNLLFEKKTFCWIKRTFVRWNCTIVKVNDIDKRCGHEMVTLWIMFVVLFELFISLFYLFIVPILFSAVNFRLLVVVLLLLLFVSGVIIFPLSIRATRTHEHALTIYIVSYISLFRCISMCVWALWLLCLIFSDAQNGKTEATTAAANIVLCVFF